MTVATDLPPPRLWTSFRDRRNENVVTVVRVAHWGHRFGALPRGGQGSVYVEVDGLSRWDSIERVDEWDWHNFELIYDPYED